MKIPTIVHFERNPRQITKNQFKRLQDTMQEFGDLSGIVINLKLDENGKEIGELVGGNQRSEAAEFIKAQPVIEREYDEPTEDGTIAEGYFDFQGKHFNCRFVRWDEEKALRANLIANAGGGTWDWDSLANLPADILRLVAFDNELLKSERKNIAAFNEFIISTDITPEFEPVDIGEQGRLDEKKPVTCPECGHEFVPKS